MKFTRYVIRVAKSSPKLYIGPKPTYKYLGGKPFFHELLTNNPERVQIFRSARSAKQRIATLVRDYQGWSLDEVKPDQLEVVPITVELV